MKAKISLSTTLITLVVIALVLTALTFLDNDTARNTYASLILLGSLVMFVVALLVRQPSVKIDEAV